jgi:hypothetical protein
MQNRYVGDIGDYLKYALLRALSKDLKLGIGWYLTPDEFHNNDGKHISYLENPNRWRFLDSSLFDKLLKIKNESRSIKLIESKNFFPEGTVFFSDKLIHNSKMSERTTFRENWFKKLCLSLDNCDLIYFDPDNGIEPGSFNFNRKNSIKSVRYDELEHFKKLNKIIIFYHHQTRFPGGHKEEINYLKCRLVTKGFREIYAFRAPAFSPRVFFIINGDLIKTQIEDFSKRSNNIFQLFDFSS